MGSIAHANVCLSVTVCTFYRRSSINDVYLSRLKERNVTMNKFCSNLKMKNLSSCIEYYSLYCEEALQILCVITAQIRR